MRKLFSLILVSLPLTLLAGANLAFAQESHAEKEVFLHKTGNATVVYFYEYQVSTGSNALRFPLPPPSAMVSLSQPWGELHCGDELIQARVDTNTLVFPETCTTDDALVRYGFSVEVVLAGFSDIFTDSFASPWDDKETTFRYALHLPQSVRIRWAASGHGIRIQTNEVQGTLQTKDINMQFRGRNLQLQITTAPSWSAVADRFGRLWADSYNSTSLPTPEDIGFDSQHDLTPMMAAKELSRFIQNHFQYQQTRSSENWRIPADSTTVWLRRYGDCKDITLMGTAILNSWGIEALPILIGTQGTGSPIALPDPFSLEHAVLGIVDDNGYSMLDLWTGKDIKQTEDRITLPLPYSYPMRRQSTQTPDDRQRS